MKTKYLTTPIYYVNDKPHIGHAYTTLATDVMARFYRLDGYKVKFLTGTDEHGQKVEKAAKAMGMNPKDFTDQVSQNFRELADAMHFSHDDFIRTTEDRHIKAAQALWQKLIDKGEIYLGSYAGWYAMRDEAFYAESELVEGKAPSGAEVEWVEEPSFFFKLSKWQEPLLEFYKKNPDFIGPDSRMNEVMRFVEGGLHDLSVSRTSFSWGVPVPNEPKHIMYVWLDALTNYITAIGYPDQTPEFNDYWVNSFHMVGKDIIRFHAVYWPAFLMAADLPPPQRVFAHGWWTNEGQKISKSVGNVIDPQDLIATYGLDQTRYFLMREVPFGSDGDFSKTSMMNRCNADLANDLGNLVQRVVSFIHKNADGVISPKGELLPQDQEILASLKALLPSLRTHIDKQTFHKALEEIWQVVSAANRYIDVEAPWTVRKTDLARMHTVLYVLMSVIRGLGILLTPFIPDACAQILDLFDEKSTDFSALDKELISGSALKTPTPIFKKYSEDAAG